MSCLCARLPHSFDRSNNQQRSRVLHIRKGDQQPKVGHDALQNTVGAVNVFDVSSRSTLRPVSQQTASGRTFPLRAMMDSLFL